MNKEREKKIKLLKALTEEQIINELCRRRKVSPLDFKLVFIHKNAFYETGEKVAKQVSQEAEQEQLKEKLQQKDKQKVSEQ